MSDDDSITIDNKEDIFLSNPRKRCCRLTEDDRKNIINTFAGEYHYCQLLSNSSEPIFRDMEMSGNDKVIINSGDVTTCHFPSSESSTGYVFAKYSEMDVINGTVKESGGGLIAHEAFVGIKLANQIIKDEISGGVEPILTHTLGFHEYYHPTLLGYITTNILFTEMHPPEYVDMATLLSSGRQVPLLDILYNLFSRLYVYYLRYRFTHYDLHLYNILIHRENYNVKIIDLECSFFRLTADMLSETDPHHLVGEHGVEMEYQRYYDRGYWLHDVFKVLMGIYYTLNECIVRSSSYIKILTTIQTTPDSITIHNYYTANKTYLLLPDDRYDILSMRKWGVEQELVKAPIYNNIITSRNTSIKIIEVLLHTISYSIGNIRIEQWLEKVRENNSFYETIFRYRESSPHLYEKFIRILDTLRRGDVLGDTSS